MNSFGLVACGKDLRDDAIGTFAFGSPPGVEYISIDRENNFVNFTASGETLLEEKCEIYDGDIYIIDEKGERITCALYNNYYLYVFDPEQKDLKTYEKVGDIPTRITTDLSEQE